jgi:hypothetical protein
MNGWHKDRSCCHEHDTGQQDPGSLPGTERAYNELVCIYARIVPAARVTGKEWRPTEITMQGKATHDYYCVHHPNTLPPLSRGVGKVPRGSLLIFHLLALAPGFLGPTPAVSFLLANLHEAEPRCKQNGKVFSCKANHKLSLWPS